MEVKIGPLTIFYWLSIGVVMSAALLFLGIVTWEVIGIPFICFFAIPALFTIAFLRLRVTKETVLSPNVLLATAATVAALVLNSFFIGEFFGYSASYNISPFANLMLGVLFAVYEETLIFCVIAGFDFIGHPWLGVLMADLVFFGLHALRYPDTLSYDLFLIVGRTIMSGAAILSGNTDTAFTSHIAYNLLVGG